MVSHRHVEIKFVVIRKANTQEFIHMATVFLENYLGETSSLPMGYEGIVYKLAGSSSLLEHLP